MRAHLLGIPMATLGRKLEKCEFIPPHAGSPLVFDVVYRAVSFDEFAALMNSGRSKRAPTGDYELKNGLLWIRAPSFQFNAKQFLSLRKILAKVQRLHGVKLIVFDVRGNGGGDSSVGGMIFEAATGGLQYDRQGVDKLAPIYAEWRVSEVAIDSLRTGLQRAVEVYGATSSQADWLREQLHALIAAQKSGRAWARQDTGERRLTREDIARRHGRLRRFAGRIAVLTDSTCMSACLDFVDEVRLVPGSLHLGATTGADSVYINTGRVDLPSGNVLIMPLEVWRNRLRGDNEPWVPDVAFDGDLANDVAVRRWVVSVLARH